MKNLIVGSLVACAFGIFAPAAKACFCIRPEVPEAFEKAKAVFAGEVIDVTKPLPQDEVPSEHFDIVKFKVERSFKGATFVSELRVLIADGNERCFPFPPVHKGEKYLVFADPFYRNGVLYQQWSIISSCSPTKLLEEADKVIKQLKSIDALPIKTRKESRSHLGDQSEIVDFCAMVDKPAQYSGRQIRLRAVLVEHPRNEIVVDGGNSYLYGAGCENKKRKVVVGWSASSYQNSTARASLREIRTSINGFGVSRASVVLSGTLSGPGKEKFGHLGWADLAFTIDDVEQAEPVAANVPHPKWFEAAYENSRKLILSQDKK